MMRHNLPLKLEVGEMDEEHPGSCAKIQTFKRNFVRRYKVSFGPLPFYEHKFMHINYGSQFYAITES